MPFSNYTGYSLRNRVFAGFLLILFLSIAGSMVLSFIVLRGYFIEQSNTEKQKKTEALMASLDYVVSHSEVDTEDIPKVLQNKIFEIADINKHDIVIYDLKGDYLISNKDPNLIPQKKLPITILNEVLRDKGIIDINTFNESNGQDMISSYLLLKNNYLQPIGVVYLPYIHNDDVYLDVFMQYLKYLLLVNLFLVALSIWLSWVVSINLTKAITKFSEVISNLTLFENEIRPIRYYKNDELNALVKAYNKLLLQIQDQKERLSIKEREVAWKEMAKQVAHEVKNPLTPMKLTLQNFERKFDPTDPDIKEKVKVLSKTIIGHIDLITAVTNAFSQFAQLPERHNERIDLNEEIKNILNVFNDGYIFFHSNERHIQIDMDKIYLSRIITNLVTNAKQATEDCEKPIINVDLERINKRIHITVEDNGTGIPKSKLDKIFEPNFTTKSGGMGLGLSMVKKMIEDYEGEIKVVSQEGKGTKFSISLPANIS